MITAGIDCGAKNTQTIIMKDDQIIGRASVLTGFDQKKAVEESLKGALKEADISRDEIDRIGGTGSGKDSIEMADSRVNDIKAIGMAAHYFFPKAGTVADVGAEEGRALKCDEGGKVIDFAINEKCAAGAGAFTESMSRALEVPLEDIGALSLNSTQTIEMNAQCAVFAESEVVSLIHAKTPKPDIARSVHDAISSRITAMVRKVGIENDVALVGGVARNVGFVDSMKRDLETELLIPEDPEYVGALGAALGATTKAQSGGD